MPTYPTRLNFTEYIDDILIAALICQNISIAAMLFGYVGKNPLILF